MAVSASIPVQAAAAIAAARLVLAEALVLKVGQVLQAVVTGTNAAGLTMLKIGDQTVQAQLPQSLPVGTTLQLAVKAGGATPQLVVVSQTLPGQAPMVAMPTMPVLLPAALVPDAPRPAPQSAPAVNSESGQPVAALGSQIDSDVPVAVVRDAVTMAVRADVAAAPALARGPAMPAGTLPEAAQVPSASGPRVPGAASPFVPAPAVAGPVPVQVATATVVARALPAVAMPVPVAEPQAVMQAMSAPVAAAVAPMVERPVVAQAVGAAPILPGAPAPVAQQGQAAAAVPPPAAPVDVEAGNPLLVAQAAARPVATMADLPRVVMPPAGTQSAPAAAVLPATPQAALAQMVPEAMAKQDSIGPLLVGLAAAVEKMGVLPEPVVRAALAVLAQRVVVAEGRLNAAVLERAVAKSGIYLEAGLAKGQPEQGDGKAALLGLRAALGKSVDAPVVAGWREAAAPPLKGLPLRAPMGELPALPEPPRDSVRTLHGQADAAVSRLKLMQMASLPDGDAARPAGPSLRLELPFLIGHELVMAQIQIARDGARREAERKRGWTMRFALNFSATGEVGAEVGLLGKAVNVALWAAEPATAEAMGAALPELSGALAALGLVPGAIRIRQGAPEPERPVSGRLLDSVS